MNFYINFITKNFNIFINKTKNVCHKSNKIQNR